MKILLLTLTALGMFMSYAPAAYCGVDAHTWNSARRKFFKEFDDIENLPKLIDEMADLNDKRAAELLCKKTLFHDRFDIRLKTFDALAATTDPEAVEFLAEQVRRDDKNRLIYVRLLNYLSGDGVTEAIKRAIGDKRWAVASAALEAARRHASEKLVETLKKELNNSNPRLAYEAGLALKACGREISEKYTSEDEGVLPSKIFSKKCLVLFDISDDMATSMALPEHAMRELLAGLKSTQKAVDFEKTISKLSDASDGELYEKYCVITRQFYGANMVARALATLDKGSEANVIVYSIGAAFWKRKFGKFSSRDISSLRKDLVGYMTRPARDFFDALRKAMSAENVDTIHIVTCGLPEGSRVEDTDYILSWLKEKNYKRSIRINTSVVLSNYADGNPSDQLKLAYEKGKEPILAFYKKIAEQNGGKFRAITDFGRLPLPLSGATAKKEPEKNAGKTPAIEKKPAKKEPEKEPKKEPVKNPEPEKKEPEKKPKWPKKDDGWLPGGK